MSEQRRTRHLRSNRRLVFSAIASLVIGISPIAASVASEAVASSLGCYIAEFSIYSRSGTFSDFYDDVPGCKIGSTDVGKVLVDVHTFGLAIDFTWPFLIVSLGVILFARRARSRSK